MKQKRILRHEEMADGIEGAFKRKRAFPHREIEVARKLVATIGARIGGRYIYLPEKDALAAHLAEVAAGADFEKVIRLGASKGSKWQKYSARGYAAALEVLAEEGTPADTAHELAVMTLCEISHANGHRLFYFAAGSRLKHLPRDAEMLARLHRGESASELAEEYGISERSVHRINRAAVLARRQRR